MATKKVEVAYGTAEKQLVIEVIVNDDASCQDVIEKSGIIKQFPEINLTNQQIGIFSNRTKLDDIPRHGDRIEIYRPLVIDPKTARRLRASRSKKN